MGYNLYMWNYFQDRKILILKFNQNYLYKKY